MKPRITIVTPSFNQARFLERTICSVLDQGYDNLEYFVIDGGSSDQSVDIIHRYASDLAWHVSEKDRGQADAINKGLARATGDIVAYLNSDDLYLPGALDQVVSIMSKPNGPQWVVGGCEQIDGDDRTLDRFGNCAPASFASYLMRTSGLLTQPSSFWGAELFHKYGQFDTSLHYSFDYEFNCRLLAAGETPTLTTVPLAAFRVHDTSKSATQAIRFGLERIEIAKRYAHKLPLADRYRLWRNIGYRQRCYTIELSRTDRGRLLWRQIARRPWWLASKQIRDALPRPRRAA